MTTLKDVAELAGVSISTVSRVLSNSGKISGETRDRVLNVANELMFKKGAVLNSIDARSYTIGLILPDHGEFFHDDPGTSFEVRSLRDSFEKNSHRCSLFFYPVGDSTSAGFQDWVDSRKPDAIVLSDPPSDGVLLDAVIATGIPYLVVNGKVPGREHSIVDFRNEFAMRDLVSRAIAMGHRRFLVLTGPERRAVSLNRLDGVRSALGSAGLSLADQRVVMGDFSIESGYSRTKDVLTDSVPDFTCVIAFSDYIALGAIRALRERGLSVPSDVSVTGFDDIEIAKYSEPPLTTVCRSANGYAALVTEELLRVIRYNDGLDFVTFWFTTPFVARESLAPPQ